MRIFLLMAILFSQTIRSIAQDNIFYLEYDVNGGFIPAFVLKHRLTLLNKQNDHSDFNLEPPKAKKGNTFLVAKLRPIIHNTNETYYGPPYKNYSHFLQAKINYYWINKGVSLKLGANWILKEKKRYLNILGVYLNPMYLNGTLQFVYYDNIYGKTLKKHPESDHIFTYAVEVDWYHGFLFKKNYWLGVGVTLNSGMEAQYHLTEPIEVDYIWTENYFPDRGYGSPNAKFNLYISIGCKLGNKNTK